VVLLGRSRSINAGHGRRSLAQSKPRTCSQVPSGSKFSLTPGLRAWPQVSRSGKDADFTSLCSPLPLLKTAGLDWRTSLAVSPVRRRHLEAVFRSPMMTAATRPSRGLRSRPASSTPRWILLRSVRLAAPRWYRFAPARRSQHRVPVCPDSSPSIPVSPRLCFPFGELPLWITASMAISHREAHLPKLPVFPVAPRTRYADCDSTLRVRRCFGGWLFLKPPWNRFNSPPASFPKSMTFQTPGNGEARFPARLLSHE
jgi:hypothetical protein